MGAAPVRICWRAKSAKCPISAWLSLRFICNAARGTDQSAEVTSTAVHERVGNPGLLCLVCASSGRTLLENEMKGLVAGLLHEAEHAQRAAQRTAALHCLQASLPAPRHKGEMNRLM